MKNEIKSPAFAPKAFGAVATVTPRRAGLLSWHPSHGGFIAPKPGGGGSPKSCSTKSIRGSGQWRARRADLSRKVPPPAGRRWKPQRRRRTCRAVVHGAKADQTSIKVSRTVSQRVGVIFKNTSSDSGTIGHATNTKTAFCPVFPRFQPEPSACQCVPTEMHPRPFACSG